MKNFTNNFKQFTSRLSARWLIMALMMLVGTSSAWGKTIYFKANGSNNWAADNAVIQISIGSNASWKKMTSLGDGMYSYEANNGATVYFARGASEGSTWNVTGKLTVPSDKNLFTPNGWSGCTGTWSTYTPPTTYTGTIKFKRPSTWNKVPHIHMFYDGNNTLVNDQEMTSEGLDASGNTWYKYDYSITTTFTTATIMFNNGGWGNGQTAEQFKGDLGTDYCLASATSTTSTKGNVTTATCPVYCDPPAAPTLNPNSTTVCSGTSFTLPSGYRWYTVETGGTKLSSNVISAGVTAKTIYYAEAGEDGCVSTSRTAYTVNVDAKPDAPTLSTTQHIVKCGDTFLKKGIITIKNFNPNYKYRMGGEGNPVLTLTEGKLGDIETASSYYVTAINGTCSTTSASAQAVSETIYTSSSVTTSGATQITATTALLTANDVVIGGDKNNIEWGFEYKTASSAVTTIKTQYSSSSTSFSYNVSPLESNTTYSYRAFVNDKTCGNIYYGEWVDFTTLVACTNTTISIAPDPAPSCSVGSLELSAVVKDASTEAVINNPGGTYVWKKADDHGVPREISGATASTYTATESGKYYVNYLRGESLYCSSKSTVYELTIENPTASIEGNECVNGTQEYTVTGSTFASYEWAAEDASTMTITNATSATANVAMKAASGILKVRGTTAAGCQSDWATMTLYAVPTVSPSATVENICEGETKTIEITTNAESIQWYKDGAAIDGATSAALDITKAGTYYAKVSNATTGCSNQSINFTVANAFGSDITPTITGATSVQSGSTGINYSTANVDEADYEWQLPTGWTFSGDKDGNQITVSAPSTEDSGTIKVNITKNGCTKTATLNVTWAKGYTVYLRRPHAKNETQQYNYWFEKSTAAGPGYIKFGTVVASPSDAQMYVYNGGSGAETPGDLGTKGTEAFTDCDGYVWDAYSIGLDVKALYFHAPNDKSTNGSTYGGYATYTRSYSPNNPISSDLYFKMGDWDKSSKGRTLTKVDKPFEGIEIDALGSTEICSNNMASFAALYLKSNCTGQEITAYAWKFSTNNSSWGEYTTGKGANTNNIRPNKAGYYHLECKLKDGSVVTSNSIQIKTTTCSISNASLNNITSNLPIIMVNTGDKAFPSVDNGKHCSASADDLKKKRSVDVKILWNKNGTVTSTDAYSNGANLYYDRKARMNYRGSSSLNFEKKSYAFCPGDEMCGDDEKGVDYVKTKKMNMFNIGSAEDKDWVLYAAYVDPSMMRNILAMETYSAMTGKWGVKNQYVELYIDGKYQGVYVFMDKITQNMGEDDVKNDGRVEVKWKIDKSDDSKSKREFILKFDKTDVADRYEDASGDQKTFESNMTGTTVYNTYDTTVDQRFEIEYPEKEDIEEDYGESAWADVYTFISGKVNEFEKAIADGDFNKVRNLINYESWADFFIINEFTKNVDAYRASCVFVFKDGKFEAWPLWDYELSFNNTVTGSGKGRDVTTGLLIEHSDVYSDSFPAPFWWTGKYKGSNMYAGLLKDPCFIQMIVSRWAEHTKEGGPLHPTTTTAKTGAYKAKLDANGAATRETTKWPIASRGKDACNKANTGYFANGGGGANTSHADSYAQLNKWLAADQRLKGLDDAIKNLAKIIEFGITATADKDETTPWRAVNVKVDAIGAGYTYTVTPAITRGQVIQGDGNLLIYAEELGDYEVTTTLDAKDQCGSTGENASAKVNFSVVQLEAVCPEP